MKYYLIPAVIFMALVAVACTGEEKAAWHPADNPLMTKWAGDVNPDMPWPEYPRPGLSRDMWLNLNGLWDYTICGKNTTPGEPEGKILVPYPVESALSGVKRRMTDSLVIWYSRNFEIPENWKGKQLILNFEASDWETTVWIDDKLVGSHKGGYDPFSFNISSSINNRKRHTIKVKVWDPTDKGKQPRGKQVSKPGGIWYTPATGIWQTVWLEPVESRWICDLKIVPSIDDASFTLTVYEGQCEAPGNCPPVDLAPATVMIHLTLDGKHVASASGEAGKPTKVIVPDPQLWSPDNPVLYDISIELISGGEISDKIKSYAGLRKIGLGKTDDGFTRLMLNNGFTWQNGPLDQGFWPDGIYTPPTDQAMVSDIEMLKKMGFNMLRKHVKVENRRYYYHTDRLGMLVWQDMPSGDDYIWEEKPDIQKSTEDSTQFITELKRMIDTKYNYPSIIMWVIYNEGWGQYNTAAVTDLVTAYDTSRLVNSASGWTDRGTGHVSDVHHYPEPVAPDSEVKRAIVLGEFGGLGLPVQDHTWEQKNWGYQKMNDSTELLRKYESFYATVRELVEKKGLSASVYTQTTDVETETNGLMTYDREVDKMGYKNVCNAHKGISK